MIERYPIGSDLTILNNFYLYPKKDPESNKWDNGSMNMVYRDNITGKKYVETFNDPEYSYHIANFPVDYGMLFIPEKDTRKVTCKFKELDKSVAEETGYLEFYKDNIRNGNRQANKLLHSEIKEVFGTNMNIEDYYRQQFDRSYSNNVYGLSKAYFDIEADIIDCKGDFPEMGECPINAITIILEKKKMFYTLLLREPNNPQIEKFEKSINEGFFQKVRELVREKVGGYKAEHRYGLHEFDYQFAFYDKEDEINLIADLFRLINSEEPDFVLAWNMAFDMPYIIERIRKLGYNPEDIICHQDFQHRVCKYFVDEMHLNDFEARGDFATISSKSVYLCQMIQFASRRKGQGAFPRFNLDFIGELIARIRKLDYSHVTSNITELCWKDYELFVLYNIIDTVMQYCIENKTGDIDYVFGKALMNNTRYAKVHRQTVYLVNRAAKEFYSEHEERFILGNNYNAMKEKPTEKFPGAFVANPLKLKPDIKYDIGGKPAPFLRNLDDYDYKSLYPSEMREFNIAPNTQIGKLIIPNQVVENENRFNIKHFDRGSMFVEDFHSHNWLPFCHRWFKLANYKELIKDVYEYYEAHTSTRNLRYYTREGLVQAITFNDKSLEPIQAIYFDDEKLMNPIRIYRDYTEQFEKVENYLNERRPFYGL